MNTSKILSLGMATLLTAAAQANPSVKAGSVVLAQDAASRQLTVDYTLEGEAAIVTVDFQTNGVSIGTANFRTVTGDVNRKVQPGARRIRWRPDKSWNRPKLTDTLTAQVTAWSLKTPPNYMMIAICPSFRELPPESRTTYYVDPDAIPFEGGVQSRECKTDYLVFRKCPAKNIRFRMGANADELWDDARWTPHYVTLTNDFWIGVYELTQKQYANFGGGKTANDQGFAKTNSTFCVQGDMRPVETISMLYLRGWCDYTATDIANGKRKYWPDTGHEILQADARDGMYGTKQENTLWHIRKMTGLEVDLPTEAQWEFAAFAGESGNLGDGTPYLQTIGGKNGHDRHMKYARFNVDSSSTAAIDPKKDANPAWGPDEGGTAIVGSYLPNAWGIYDMCGNVAEMCLDVFENYTADEAVDPPGPKFKGTSDATKKNRAVRGGSWADQCWNALKVTRVGKNCVDTNPSIGYRLCVTIP